MGNVIRLSTYNVCADFANVEIDSRLFDSGTTQEYNLPAHTYSQFVSAWGGLLIGSSIELFVKFNNEARTLYVNNDSKIRSTTYINSTNSNKPSIYHKFYVPAYGQAMVAGILNQLHPFPLNRFTTAGDEATVGTDTLFSYTKDNLIYAKLAGDSKIFNCGILSAFPQTYPSPTATQAIQSTLTTLTLSNLRVNLYNGHITFSRTASLIPTYAPIPAGLFYPVYNIGIHYKYEVLEESHTNIYPDIAPDNTRGGLETFYIHYGTSSSEYTTMQCLKITSTDGVNSIVVTPSSISSTKCYFLICGAGLPTASSRSRLYTYKDNSCTEVIVSYKTSSVPTIRIISGTDYYTPWTDTTLTNHAASDDDTDHNNGPYYQGSFIATKTTDDVTGTCTIFGYVKVRLEYDSNGNGTAKYYTKEIQIKLFGVFKNGVLQS